MGGHSGPAANRVGDTRGLLQIGYSETAANRVRGEKVAAMRVGGHSETAANRVGDARGLDKSGNPSRGTLGACSKPGGGILEASSRKWGTS